MSVEVALQRIAMLQQARTDPAALLAGTHYDVAINCAAFHNVDT